MKRHFKQHQGGFQTKPLSKMDLNVATDNWQHAILRGVSALQNAHTMADKQQPHSLCQP